MTGNEHAKPKPPPTILCIEDDSLLLDFLILAVKEIAPRGAAVIGARSGKAGLELARGRSPQVVILDLGLPDMPGLQVALELAALPVPPRVLVLSSTAPGIVLCRVAQGPIHGYLVKGYTQSDELRCALNELLKGRVYFQPQVVAAMATIRRQSDHFMKLLTARELELVSLFGFGWSHEKVAEFTSLSTATVRTHHQNILTKLNLHRREDLMRWAITNGFTDFRYEPSD